AATVAPNPLNSTLKSDRFIARLIAMVRIVPDAPTSAPLTMRTSLLSTNPVVAAARPVNELSSEMITGMSAPPMGITNRAPSASGEHGAKVLRRDERGAASPHAVEQGHHLRHRRHAHQARRANAERPADHERRDDERPVAGAGDQPEGDTEYEKHADRSDAVPAQRRRRRAKQLDTDHEAEGGTGVAENREARGHQAPGCAPVVGATGSAASLRVSAGARWD